MQDRGFFRTILQGIIQDAIKFVIAFAIGTGAGAIVCWYYDLPLLLAFVGGVLVLGVALALLSNSLFS